MSSDLIERFVRGDREAFAAVAREHGPALQRLTRAIVKDDAAAADATQEALLAAFRAASTYRPERGELKPWLLAIARREAYRLRSRGPLEREVVAETDSAEPLAALGARAGWSADDPEAMVARAEDRERLSWALASLPSADREVLWLRDVEGLSGEETAAVIGCDLTAMKSRLHRARLKLMAALREGDVAVTEREREAGGLRCSQVLAQLSDYVDGAIDTAARAAIDEHLKGCSVCERFGGRFRRTVATVRSGLAARAPLDEKTYLTLVERLNAES